MGRIVCISGGFDPIHRGHIELLEIAAQYGEVVVILNSDAWLARKKTRPFMEWEDRKAVVGALKGVASVTPVNDADGTVCEALMRIKPDYFINSGDRRVENTPELTTCLDYGIKPIFLGQPKVQSSTAILDKWKKYAQVIEQD